APPLGSAAFPCPDCAADVVPPRSPGSEELVPGSDPDAAEFLGGAGLRDPAALRHADGGRYLPHGDDAARTGAEAVEGRLCAAEPPADRWPLWRKSQPAAALLPVPGDPEALAGQHPGPLPAVAGRDRARFEPARHPFRRGRLGKPDAGRLGPRLGVL